MTLTLLAHDADAGLVGVAITSLLFDVGPACVTVAAGVGVAVTTHLPVAGFGAQALDALRGGTAPATVVRDAVTAEAGAPMRQLAVLDIHGRHALHTGGGCVGHAGHIDDGAAIALGVLLDGPGVLPAAVEGLRADSGALADRLLAGLAAGVAAGGDVRGVRSAALLVVPTTPGGEAEAGVVSLHVADHDDPVGELQRLLRVQRAHRAAWAAFAQANAGDVAAALDRFETLGDHAEAAALHGLVRAAAGDGAGARARLAPALRDAGRVERYLGALARAGFIPAATTESLSHGE